MVQKVKCACRVIYTILHCVHIYVRRFIYFLCKPCSRGNDHAEGHGDNIIEYVMQRPSFLARTAFASRTRNDATTQHMALSS